MCYWISTWQNIWSWIILLYLHPLVIFSDKEQQLSTLSCFQPNKDDIAIHFKIEVDGCTPPNRSQIKGLLSKTLKSLFRPSNPKYACHIHLTCSHLRLWMNFVKQQDSFSNDNVYCLMNQTCPNQPLFACTFIFSPNLFMCVAWGIQIHKLFSLVSENTWNIWKLWLFQFCCSRHKY